MIDWEAFHFLRPVWLAACLLLVPWLWLFLRRGRRSGAWRRVCDAHLLRHLLVDDGGGTRRWPALLVAAAWSATCLALAGPAWERLPQPTVDLAEHRVLVLSLAPSMTATDVAPSRIARARFAARDALRALPGADVGLVIYAEEPYAVTPLTDDPDVIEAVLPLLEPSLMPGRGARLDRAVDEARSLLEGAGAHGGRIVVLTDGPGQAPDAARAAAERALDAGFRVGVLGVGGGDDAGLEALASAGGGRFAPVGVDSEALAAVVGAARSSFGSGESVARNDVQVDTWRDGGRLLLWLPLLIVPVAFRRGWAGALAVAGLLLVQPDPAQASVADDLFARPDQQGARAFAAGQHDAAAGLFQDPAWRAAALYRDGDYAGAATALEGREDLDSVYNRGNALAHSGRLEESLAAYEQVLAEDPDHEDARHNRDLVEQLLEQQKQQQQQSQAQQDDPSQPQSSEGSDQAQSGESESQSDPGESQGDEDSSQQSSSQQSSSQPGADGQEGQASPDSSSDAAAQSPSDAIEPPEAREAEDAGSAEAATQQADAADAAGEERETGGERDTSDEAAPPQQASAAEAPSELPPTETPETAGAGAGQQPLSESEQATEQWLRRVPDDPAGLLREKLRRRYAERRYGVRLGGIR